METIAGILFVLSLLSNGIQHFKAEKQDQVIAEQKKTIQELSIDLQQSIDGANNNASILIETNTDLTQCLVVLKESRELQEAYRIDADRAQMDNKALENRLSNTDWGSMRIPDFIDF